MNLAGTLGTLLRENNFCGGRNNNGLGHLLAGSRTAAEVPAALQFRFAAGSSSSGFSQAHTDESLCDLLTLALQESAVEMADTAGTAAPAGTVAPEGTTAKAGTTATARTVDTAGTETAAVTAPSAAQTDEAVLLIRAMLNAAKCDGQVDEAEMASVLKHVEDLGQEELVFISREIRKPVNLDTFISTVPRGMERSVYLMSLLAITVDTAAESRYLQDLARGLELMQEEVIALHEQVGATLLKLS